MKQEAKYFSLIELINTGEPISSNSSLS